MSAPAYDPKAAEEELATLEKDGISADDKTKAHKAMAKELGKEATIKALMDEVNTLGANTRQMDQSIRNIYITFGEIDNAGFNFPRKLQPEWGAIKDEWTALLWESRDAASRVAANLHTFNTVTMPVIEQLLTDGGGDEVENIARCRGILKRYIDGNSPVADITMDGSGNYSQRFTNLQTKMNIFKNSFDDFTKAERARIEAQITSVKSQINSINADIQSSEAAASRLGRCLGITIFGTVVAAGISLFAFGLLGPLVAIGVLIVGATIAIIKKKQMIAHINRANELRGQLAARQAELNNLQNKLKLLEKCEAQLQANKVAIGNVAERIGGIAAIWSMLRSNAVELSTMLGDASDMTDMAEILPMLDVLKNAYNPLKDALRTYATQIDSAGIGR